jgi:ATP-dependent Lon protease
MRTHAPAQLGLGSAMFEKSDVHIHVPAPAIPKDGPSAGVAMYPGPRLAADQSHGLS